MTAFKQHIFKNFWLPIKWPITACYFSLRGNHDFLPKSFLNWPKSMNNNILCHSNLVIRNSAENFDGFDQFSKIPKAIKTVSTWWQIMNSVTRYGEISPLWHFSDSFLVFGKILNVLCANKLCYWANFNCGKWPDI